MSGATSDARRRVAARMADEAQTFLASLDETQRAVAQWPFPSDDERRRWFYTPTDHGGLPLGAMTPPQQRLAHRLIASGVSRAGYVTVATIMGLDNVLDELEGWRIGFDRPRGRDPLLYYVRVFGEPAPDGEWGWRVGGHHVSLHHTVVDGEVVASTPSFLGADPASSPLLGPHPLRPLAGVEDDARELVRSLDEAQLEIALASPVPPTDIVGANRPQLSDGDLPIPLPDVWRQPWTGDIFEFLDGAQRATDAKLGITAETLDAVRLTKAPKGVPAAALRADQRELLVTLLHRYVDRLPDDLAGLEAAKVADDLNGLHFLWAGGTEPGEPHYYRVQGTRLLVEYDNTARNANHVHSVWRDLTNDFGDDVLARHRAQHH